MHTSCVLQTMHNVSEQVMSERGKWKISETDPNRKKTASFTQYFLSALLFTHRHAPALIWMIHHLQTALKEKVRVSVCAVMACRYSIEERRVHHCPISLPYQILKIVSLSCAIKNWKPIMLLMTVPLGVENTSAQISDVLFHHISGTFVFSWYLLKELWGSFTLKYPKGVLLDSNQVTYFVWFWRLEASFSQCFGIASDTVTFYKCISALYA